ncbi:MAG: superoxide dismutase family protein [Bacteroidia bacterium]|nr:superoxide dismutase family protein [Bacteroidia bacterium]NND24704.1 superoxide dismutase family protein [Flavobacteriaceae bacterium]MBT8278802.1 superoxide dismutase family protein [Bacteroidia bacterium]NNK59046.1 superoxide dismutase family protein [Flavobacteriaceae bacterium]NNL33768.1 superoxide dismutase family protein [Flavobacteriaceae bacterium]
MKKIYLIMMIGSMLLTVACKKDTKSNDGSSDADANTEVKETIIDNPTTSEDAKVLVQLEPKSNSNVSGNVVFKQENGIVTMTAVMSGLKEGMHAIHLHEKSDCSSADGTSTGGHWNPTAQPHGKWGDAAGYHKGDIGNFTADANGNGIITHVTKEWCIGCGDPQKDIMGKAVIIHEGIDDFKTQPTGDAGGRVSCGAVIQ